MRRHTPKDATTKAFAPVEERSARGEVHALLATVKGQSFLFSKLQREVFALNDTAAKIWRGLDHGDSVRTIASRLSRRGADRLTAEDYVRGALREWERLGLIRPPLEAAKLPETQVSQLVGLPGLRVRILYPVGRAEAARAVFQHLEPRGDAIDVEFSLLDRQNQLHLFRDGEWRLSCSAEELPTMLKGQLLAEVLKRDGYELALHAAALVRGGRVLLICGPPGAGKTTLALTLASAGFGFAGDDVTLLTRTGECIGLPFAPAVKAGAWNLLAGRCRELAAAPVFRRPDGKRVRYPALRTVEQDLPRKIGWVLRLNRTAGGRASLRPLEPMEALPKLIDGSFARDRELSEAAFQVLIELIETTEVWELTYARLDHALDLLVERCR